MSKSLVNMFRLIESLSDAPKKGLSKGEVVDKAGLPTSTVYRLMAELEKAGYVYQTGEGKVLPNFSFERRIALGDISPERLRAACENITRELQSASEIILHRGHNLLWHITDEHPARALKLRAHPGYVRATYELDSISRLVLAHLDMADIEKSWDLSAFYDVGVHGNRVPWEEARKRILSTDKSEMQYDMMGNAKGVRRFCVSITDARDRLICLLTIAEAATPLRDEQAHIERMRETLMRTKSSLQASAADIQEDELRQFRN